MKKEKVKKQKVEKQKPSKKEISVNRLVKPALYVFFAVLLEIINFLFVDFAGKFGTDILPKYFMLDLGIILIVAALIFLALHKNWLGNIVFYFMLFLQVVINVTNGTLYKVFGDIFSFDMMKLGMEAVEAFKFEFVNLWCTIVNILVFGIIIATQILCDKYIKKTIVLERLGKPALVLSILICITVVSETVLFTQTNNFARAENEEYYVAEDDEYLWDNMHFKLEAYRKFGTFGFYLKSLGNLITGTGDYDDQTKEDMLAKLEQGQKQADENAVLRGDNLIVLMLESFEWFAIDPINTPTLWDIRTQSGVAMENFYGKNKTNVSEDISLLGSMPKDTSMSWLADKTYLDTKYSLPNLLKEQGYQTTFFHGYRKTFYDRAKVNTGMGFDNVYGIEDADFEGKSLGFNNWNLDSDFVKNMTEKGLFIPEDTKFFSFLTTITTHGSYSTTNKKLEPYFTEYDENLEEYKTWLKDNTTYKFPTDSHNQKTLRQYKCAAMDTDRTVEYIMAQLTERNLLDKTTIVMFADHNSYYEDLCYNIKGALKDDYQNIYNYNIPMMIYSNKLQAQQNTTFCNTYDIFPTICELMGLPYNSALTHGYNIFSNEIENSLMSSNLSGIFNSEFYSINITNANLIAEINDPEVYNQRIEVFKQNACKYFEKQHDIEIFYRKGLLK